MGFPKKFLMALCRASIRLPFPTSIEKFRAPRDGRCTGHGVARGELATVFADAGRATKSTDEPNTTVVLHAFALSHGLSAGATRLKSHDSRLPLRVRQAVQGPPRAQNIRSATVVLKRGSSSIWLQASRVMLRDADQSGSAAFPKPVERFPVSGWTSGVERRVGRRVRTQ
jgi:hypothetical protein